MKKIILSFLIVSILLAGQSSAQGDTKGWPSVERHIFIRECIITATPNLGPDSARFYCWCMQEKVEKKYPTIEAAEKITEADMASPGWQQDIKACGNGGSWTAKDRSGFLSECISSAREGTGEEKAKYYCECMLFKLEKKYPNADAMGEITEEKLTSPEWQKMINACLAF